MRSKGLIILISTSVFVAILASITQFREGARDFLFSKDRNVLAKIQTDLNGNGERVTIIKVKTRDTLSVEVYFEANQQKEMARIILSELRDGFTSVRGRMTNLAADDIDGDGVLEIIAPAFDENLIMRLNVFKFDSENRKFHRLGPENLSL